MILTANFFKKMGVPGEEDYSLAEISRITKISANRVISSYEYYLFMWKQEQGEKKVLCPTCGRTKLALRKHKVCSDNFHFV